MFFNINSENLPAWIQAIAAIFAAIGLIYTLRLQAKATKIQGNATQFQLKAIEDQSKLMQLQIESAKRDEERFHVENYPVFKIANVYRDPDKKSGALYIHVTKGIAYDCTFLNWSSGYEFINFRDKTVGNYAAGVRIRSNYHFKSNQERFRYAESPKEEENVKDHSDLSIVVCFKDTRGIHYRQHWGGNLLDDELLSEAMYYDTGDGKDMLKYKSL